MSEIPDTSDRSDARTLGEVTMATKNWLAEHWRDPYARLVVTIADGKVTLERSDGLVMKQSEAASGEVLGAE